jgi:glucose/mannose-6-phosphate isomerase
MGMEQAIRDFPKQFEFEPVIKNAENLIKKDRFIVAGMGGSHLAADLLQAVYQTRRIAVRADYGLPLLPEEELRNSVFIASSYSGNTEEIVDGLEKALEKHIASAVISIGGKLETIAKEHVLPYVTMPDTGIQPRSALGLSLLGIMKLMRMDAEIQKLHSLASTIVSTELEAEGKTLSETIRGRVPVIYTSAQNKAIAYIWKIKCNETGKIPAFYNIFSELNHNEMTGYDVITSTKHLSQPFHFIFLRDTEDDPRVQKRMDICKKLYEARGLPVTDIFLKGSSRWERIFNSLLLSDWFAFHSGSAYGAETEQVPMVEEFKKRIS